MRTKLALLSICIITMFSSCEKRRIENATKKLQSYPPNSKALYNELATEMAAHPADFKYILKDFMPKPGDTVLSIGVEHGAFKTTLPVLVTNWKKIEGIKRTKGMGYFTAELSGLQLNLITKGDQAVFTYKTLDTILD